MAFAVFDVETRVDKHLLNRVYYDGQALSDSEAFERYREDLRRRRDSDFFPITLHLPISIAIGNVGDDYVLNSVESLALGDYSEEKLVREFWARAERFAGTLVSFNGRRFDIPVLELAALRHAIAAPIHFAEEGGARAHARTTLPVWPTRKSRDAASTTMILWSCWPRSLAPGTTARPRPWPA